MPVYTFKKVDGSLTTKRISFHDYEDVQSGVKVLMDGEGSPLELIFDPVNVKFTLKDGESGGWASKALKENRYRSVRSKAMARREKDHVFKLKLVPNFKGQEASSWKEVQAEVKAEKGAASASTYDRLVTQETSKS